MHHFPIAQMKRGLDTVRSVLKVKDTIAELQKRVDQQQRQLETLSSEVADLQHKRALTPRDVEAPDGIPWGLVGTSTEPQPFCPTCAANGQWSLVPRVSNRVNQNYFHCQTCKANHQLTRGLREWMIPVELDSSSPGPRRDGPRSR